MDAKGSDAHAREIARKIVGDWRGGCIVPLPAGVPWGNLVEDIAHALQHSKPAGGQRPCDIEPPSITDQAIHEQWSRGVRGNDPSYHHGPWCATGKPAGEQPLYVCNKCGYCGHDRMHPGCNYEAAYAPPVKAGEHGSQSDPSGGSAPEGHAAPCDFHNSGEWCVLHKASYAADDRCHGWLELAEAAARGQR